MANIELDGANKTLKVDSGDLTLDIPGDIILDADGANVTFKDGGTAILDISNSSSDAVITSSVQDKDIIFKGDDGGSAITALTLDMSAAGAATFNGAVTAGGILKTDDTTEATSTTDGSLQTDGGLSVAKDTVMGDDLKLLSDASVIHFGANSEVTLTHSHDAGLNLKHTATADDKPIVLTLQTGETDMAADDVMGKIAFQAPDEGTGTDAILVAAAIQAVSEGDFSSSSNATRLEFMTGASEAAAVKMAIASDGDVGIGTTSPLGQLHVKTGAQAGSPNVDADADELVLESDGNCGLNILCPQANTGTIAFSDDGDADIGIIEYVHSDNSMRFTTNTSERMRITSTGIVSINGGTARGSTVQIADDLGGGYEALSTHTVNTGNATQIAFCNPNGTVGYINTNGTATSYATSSDYRLKENETSITDGITRLKNLKPYRFNFKVDPDTTVDGFFAHEVSSIVPEAISGEKDAVDSDGNIEPQGIDQSKLVPLLTKALQEAITKIETLETKVTALEG